jgi:hypothetical protein
VQIRLTVHGQTTTGTLNDTSTGRDFASLLPLTLNMQDLFGREKPRHFLRRSTLGKGQATDQVGDLAYRAPSRDLAILYADDRKPSQALAS